MHQLQAAERSLREHVLTSARCEHVACGADRWRLLTAVSPLEGFDAHEWVCFERALVVRDLFTGGVRTFFSTADAQHFRARLYQHYGVSLL